MSEIKSVTVAAEIIRIAFDKDKEAKIVLQVPANDAPKVFALGLCTGSVFNVTFSQEE